MKIIRRDLAILGSYKKESISMNTKYIKDKSKYTRKEKHRKLLND